jgi:hypothetical protein
VDGFAEETMPGTEKINEKFKGCKLIPPLHTQLYNEARGLRENLRTGSPSPEDLGSPVTSWGEVCITGDKANVKVPSNFLAPLGDGSTLEVQNWMNREDVACTDILRQCVKYERKIKQSTISSKINSRLVEHILSMEEGGSSSGFLRRAAFNGTTQSGHVQATLPKGGASVEPVAVKNGLFSTYRDWFAPRKHGPGGSAGPGRPDILEIYEGIGGRIQAGSDKCVAHNITM